MLSGGRWLVGKIEIRLPSLFQQGSNIGAEAKPPWATRLRGKQLDFQAELTANGATSFPLVGEGYHEIYTGDDWYRFSSRQRLHHINLRHLPPRVSTAQASLARRNRTPRLCRFDEGVDVQGQGDIRALSGPPHVVHRQENHLPAEPAVHTLKQATRTRPSQKGSWFDASANINAGVKT